MLIIFLIIAVNNILKYFRQKRNEKRDTYYGVLRNIHNILKPKKYVEIGVRAAESIILANKNTICYGVDPNPIITRKLYKNTHIFNLTSDDFFKDYEKYNINNLSDIIGGIQ